VQHRQDPLEHPQQRQDQGTAIVGELDWIFSAGGMVFCASVDLGIVPFNFGGFF
jgi:hypothetical protein